MKKVRRPQKVKSLKHAINERFFNYKKQRIHRRTFCTKTKQKELKNLLKNRCILRSSR